VSAAVYALQAPGALERIEHAGRVLALIVYREFDRPGISFFTPEHLSQQLGFMRHPAGTVIAPHLHNPVPRQVAYTQETLFVRNGRLRVDFYDQQANYLESRDLRTGDVILLIEGGHGFEMLDETEIVEVKQGPYAGSDDKTVFAPGPRATARRTTGGA
jgi:hypothetical protein